MSCLISWGRCRINEVSIRFVNILCQHGRREAGSLILEDDLSRVISLLLVKSSLRIEKQEVWDVFIHRKSFPVGVTPQDDVKDESPPY